MTGIWDFIWNNWDWIGAAGFGPAAWLVRTDSRRWLKWVLLVLAILMLCIWALRAHGRAVDKVKAEAAAVEADRWRGKLKATEDAARDTIRRREAAAYQRAVDDERARAAADAKDAQAAATIVERVIKVSPSARDCTVDQATADALNELRGGE